MATTTPNFGWAVPTSTDLVKDGAVAIETLGDSIDASLVDLKGGTTGQVLSKTSATDMDFTWTTASGGGAVQVIQTITTTSGATNVSFTSIPSTYKNLRIVYSAAITAGAWEFFLMRFNNNTGSNYDRQTLQGRAGSATAAETYGSTSMHIAQINQVNATVGEIVIPAYKDTVLDKLAVSTFFGKHGTSSTNQFTGVFGGAFRSTAAITQIDLFPDTAKVYVTGSTFTLYGES